MTGPFVGQQRQGLPDLGQMGRQKVPVEQILPGHRNVRGVQLVPAGQGKNRVHGGGVLHRKGGDDDKIFVLCLDLRQALDPLAVKALPADKRVAGEKVPDGHPHPVQMVKNVVGAVTHAVHDHRLLGLPQTLPTGGQG